MDDYQYDSSWSSWLKPLEPANVSTNLIYDPVPRHEADAPLVVETPLPDWADGGPPRQGIRAMSQDCFVAKLMPPAPRPVVLTYGDLAVLEAAALAVGQGLLPMSLPGANPWDEEIAAEARCFMAEVGRKLQDARRAGRPVAVEPTMPAERGLPDDE